MGVIMDISSLSTGLSVGLSKSKLPAASQIRSMTDGLLVSLLPSASSRTSTGLGANLDIYAAVSQQSLGVLSGGRSALEIANLNLGIDMSQQTAVATADAGNGVAATPAQPDTTSDGTTPQPADKRPEILDQILKEAGYVKQDENPYVVQKDFFAVPETLANKAPSQYFSSPSLSNPGLGGLLNSLG